MNKYKHLSTEETQQMAFDWRYRGFTTIELLTESEVDEINVELDRLRVERNSNEPEKWQEFEPFMYPHKLSNKLEKLFAHPKLIEAAEFLMEGDIIGMQTWAYFKPPGELGRDAHQDGFYSQSGWNNIANISISLDPSDENNGGMWAYEGSHYLPLLDIEIDEERTKTNPGNWRNERGKSSKMPEGHNFPKVYDTLKKGQVTFLHSHVVHGSAPNRDTNGRMRRSYLISYLKDGADFKPGNQMKREPIDVYELRQKYWGE